SAPHSAARLAVQARRHERRESRTADLHHAADHESLGAEHVMRSIFQFQTATGLALVLTSAMGMASCASELTRTGASPAYLVIDSILGAQGNNSSTFGTPLFSDVQTLVDNGTAVRSAVVYNDLGQVRMRVLLKNPTTPTGPSSLNSITVNRYHVEYRRSDGRNTPGVDVPYGFDGGATFTVQGDAP